MINKKGLLEDVLTAETTEFIFRFLIAMIFSKIFTVQLGYYDSYVTDCLLFWNMPIIQDRDVKFPYKRYTYYL